MVCQRIAIIEPVGGHGGMDFYDYGLAMGIAAHGTHVQFHSCDQTVKKTFENVTTYHTFGNLWSKGKLGKLAAFLGGYRRAFRQAHKEQCSVVHLHFFQVNWLNYLVVRMTRNYNFKTVITLHDVDPLVNRSSNRAHRMIYQIADCVIVHNEFSRKELLQKPIDPAKIAVIPHGNYLPFIEAMPKKDVSDEISLLFFGQIKELKGLDLLLRALQQVRKEHANVRLTIAGRPWHTNANTYEQLIRELNLSDCVTTRFDYIPNEEVAAYFNASDLVVLPYKRIYQSGVLLLSMSYGRPCLTSDLEPFSEIITDGENGFLFKSESVEALAKKLTDIIMDTSQLKKVTEQASKILVKNYDWKVIGQRTLEAYQLNSNA